MVTEKLARRGEAIGRVAGVVFLVLAVAVALSPTVADAVVPSGSSDPAMGMTTEM